MRGFDTGHKDHNGRPFLVGSRVEWIDSEGFPCRSEIVVVNGCKIGVYSWEGFIFVCDFEIGYKGFKVVEWEDME